MQAVHVIALVYSVYQHVKYHIVQYIVVQYICYRWPQGSGHHHLPFYHLTFFLFSVHP